MSKRTGQYLDESLDICIKAWKNPNELFDYPNTVIKVNFDPWESEWVISGSDKLYEGHTLFLEEAVWMVQCLVISELGESCE